MFEQRTPKHVAVLGLGYVGLPLIRACINAGHKVTGFDVDQTKIEGLCQGRSHVDDVTDSEIAVWLQSGLHVTSDSSSLSDIDTFVICVPTPLSKVGGPDLSAVEVASQTIESRIDPSRKPLVILESTTYPGTTEEVVKPILEKNGRKAGSDFSLAFSPERIDPGNKEWTFENTPKVVGGLTPSCSDAAVTFYEALTVRVVRAKGLKEAEMSKLLENTYRHVNIALVNEMWKLSHELGIDIWDVIDAAETKPYGFQAFRPGPGVGGHCIPIDPNYLSHRVKSELGQPFRFVELAQEINASMPEFVIRRAQEILNEQGKSLKGSHILILGVTYKADVADIRESPALPLIQGLLRRGALVSFDDPFVPNLHVSGSKMQRVASRDVAIESADLTILLQSHKAYRSLDLSMRSRVLDTRGEVQ